VVEAVRRLLAVQAQDYRSARLALRARTAGLVAADVDRALDERALVIAWLGRGTLHVVCAEDHPWLLAVTAPPRFATNRRRLGQEGVSPDDAERAVALIERALEDEGALTRPELAERIAARGIRTEGQAMPHLLMLAALRGVIVRTATHFVPAHPAPPVDRAAALAELARRYLAGHGPATADDLAAWAGVPLRDARAGLCAIDVDELGGGLLDLPGRGPAPERIPPRLLPAFDPYLLGWKDRSFAVPAEHAAYVHPGGGMLRAVATVDGLVVGGWDAAEAELDAERADVARFEMG